ncbi:MAG: PAS domain S-box protein [Candidatus Krumholzibacteriia bacterium]
MSLASLPAIIVGTIAAFVGAVHLFVYFRGAGPRRHLTFGVTCLSMALYDAFSAALYSADSAAAGVVWQRWQVLTMLAGGVPLTWFVHDVTTRGPRWVPRALTAAYLSALAAWFLAPERAFFLDRPAVKAVVLPGGGRVVYHEMATGPLFLIVGVLGLLTFVYAVRRSLRTFPSDRRWAAWLLASIAIFFAGAANDLAISLGLHDSIYVMEIAFLAPLLMMSYSLTERGLAAARREEALQFANQTYREVLDAVNDAVYIHDADTGRIVDVNAAAERIYGFSRDEICRQGPELRSAAPPAEARRLAAEYVRRTVDDGPQLFVWHARRKDGSTFWVEVSLRATAIREQRRVIAVVRDITGRKEAEEALLSSRRELIESNHMLQLVLDTIPVRVFWKDRDLRYLGCNRLFALDAGLLTPEEIVGSDDLELGWREDAEGYRSDDRIVLESEQPRVGYEETQTTPSGGRIWLRTSKLPLRDADGVVIGVLGVYEDITDRRRQQEALRRSEENLTITLNSIGDGVIATDADGRVTRMNPVAEQLTGWTLAQARGRPLGEVFLVARADSGEAVPDPASRVMAADAPEELGRELILTARGGRERFIADSGAPIRDRQGAIAGVVLVFRDITEEKQLQEQLRQAQKMEAIGRLAGGVAHDFNNLLQAIEGYRSLAALSLGDPEHVRECLDDIGHAAQRGADLTRRLLTFGRRQSSELRLLHLGRLVEDAARMLGPLLGRDVSLELRHEAPTAPVLADPLQLEQVLLNLVVNARDAMPGGGIITVTTRPASAREVGLPPKLRTRPGEHVALEVADTGTGIAAEIQERVFEPFFTTKEVGAGTGLGLATVYGIVERLGGGVAVRSSPGCGATFTVYLPGAARGNDVASPPAGRGVSPQRRDR